MPDLAYDLRYLKYAMVAAEFGSFRRAAEALELSQSTVSRRILSLERRLGLLLFERNRTGARPTPAGEQFIRDAAFGAHHLQQAVADLRQMRCGRRGRVRVGVTASLGSRFLITLLSDFRARFPGVEVQFQEASSHTNAASVSGGRLDAAIVSGRLRLPQCATRELWQERIYVALPQKHALAERNYLTWHDLRHEEFVINDEGLGPDIEALLLKRLGEAGVHPKIAVHRVGRENLVNLVAQSFGLTLTTNSTFGVNHAQVAFIPISDEADSIVSSLIWMEGNQNPVLRKLVELCEVLADHPGQRSVGIASSAV